MAIIGGLSRRAFLRVGLGVAEVGLLSVCAPAVPATKPAEAPKPAEAVKPAAGKPESELGAQLVGEIEGAVIQPEAKRPAKLGEPPMLAELVKAGKLPPVE